ncbi:hypothetical protein ACODT5_32745 [Streptomyces sp. 5.8]|uniref:hypothetical protein n=1 Tax=Streptomyces sp. 5.8 TaxID=3406571 RepID=UPI003BB5325D
MLLPDLVGRLRLVPQVPGPAWWVVPAATRAQEPSAVQIRLATPSDANLLTSHPNTDANRWQVWLKNPAGAGDTGVRVYTICQPTG